MPSGNMTYIVVDRFTGGVGGPREHGCSRLTNVGSPRSCRRRRLSHPVLAIPIYRHAGGRASRRSTRKSRSAV
jgi:hypothetical protein